MACEFVTADNSTDGTALEHVGDVSGHPGAAPAYSGTAYRRFIKAEVDAFVSAGRYPILDLHWTATGAALATQQDVAPKVERSLPFWTEVAKTFKHSPAVVCDLFNEPRLWCYSSARSRSYATAGPTTSS